MAHCKLLMTGKGMRLDFTRKGKSKNQVIENKDEIVKTGWIIRNGFGTHRQPSNYII